MCADDVAFSESVFGIPSSFFDHIKICKYAKEILNIIKDLFEISENVKDKRMTSVVNDYDMFTTSPSESVAFAAKFYRILVNNMTMA